VAEEDSGGEIEVGMEGQLGQVCALAHVYGEVLGEWQQTPQR